jgi:hypothetical protein
MVGAVRRSHLLHFRSGGRMKASPVAANVFALKDRGDSTNLSRVSPGCPETGHSQPPAAFCAMLHPL